MLTKLSPEDIEKLVKDRNFIKDIKKYKEYMSYKKMTQDYFGVSSIIFLLC